MQYKNKKNLYKIVFITVLLGFIISLVGCNWLSLGLLNIFDPQAQIRVNYTGMDLEAGTIALEVYSLNEVEFIGSGFSYKYYSNNVLISDLSKTVGATFYVAPSISPGTPGPTTTINLLLYYKEVQDYIKQNPLITELTCTISLLGTDGAGHSISKSVTVDLPALQPGIDITPPVANIVTKPDPPTGKPPLSVVFDASGSTDEGSGIASYSWDFGDGTSATGVMPAAHTYTSYGTYTVKLTVTDFWGNEGYATKVIKVVVPGVSNITVNANPQSNVPGGTSIISAIVTNTEGDVVADGTTVYFYTNSGTLSADSANTTNGIAKVNLTLDASMQDGEKAKVTAFIGEVSGSVEVTCTEVGAKIDTTPSPATGFVPFTVGFDASGSTVASPPVVSYAWDFDGNGTTDATGVTAVHTFASAGTYLVQLTVTDSAATANVYVAFVTVIANTP